MECGGNAAIFYAPFYLGLAPPHRCRGGKELEQQSACLTAPEHKVVLRTLCAQCHHNRFDLAIRTGRRTVFFPTHPTVQSSAKYTVPYRTIKLLHDHEGDTTFVVIARSNIPYDACTLPCHHLPRCIGPRRPSHPTLSHPKLLQRTTGNK